MAFMDIIKERVLILASYICDHHATVRDAAHKFGISKSTVHKDVTQKLKYMDPAKYIVVRAILDENKAERHLRGGEATRMKYKIRKQQKEGKRGTSITERVSKSM